MTKHKRTAVFATIFGLLMILGWGLYLQTMDFFHQKFPNVHRLAHEYPVRQPSGEVKISKIRPASWTSLGQISSFAVAAVILSEDGAFYQHEGMDFNALKESIEEDLEKGRFARGASTITMQVVKNCILSQQKTLSRKIQEAILAIELDRKVSKKRILEIYFNVVEWGPNIYGITKASQYYFQKNPIDLDPKESAFLAMLLPSPVRYSQSFRQKKLTRFASKSIQNILRKMHANGRVDQSLYEASVKKPLSFEKLEFSQSSSDETVGDEDPSNDEEIQENSDQKSDASRPNSINSTDRIE